MFIHQLQGDPSCGPGVPALLVGRIGTFPRLRDVIALGRPPGRLGQAFQVLGSQRRPLVRLLEEVVSLLPGMSLERVAG
jgi:hypothetical protein